MAALQLLLRWSQLFHEIVDVFVGEDWDALDSEMAQFHLVFRRLVLFILPFVALDVKCRIDSADTFEGLFYGLALHRAMVFI